MAVPRHADVIRLDYGEFWVRMSVDDEELQPLVSVVDASVSEHSAQSAENCMFSAGLEEAAAFALEKTGVKIELDLYTAFSALLQEWERVDRETELAEKQERQRVQAEAQRDAAELEARRAAHLQARRAASKERWDRLRPDFLRFPAFPRLPDSVVDTARLIGGIAVVVALFVVASLAFNLIGGGQQTGCDPTLDSPYCGQEEQFPDAPF